MLLEIMEQMDKVKVQSIFPKEANKLLETIPSSFLCSQDGFLGPSAGAFLKLTPNGNAPTIEGGRPR
ncbi:hypothetical protein TNCV_4861861 [Trichonephila clavipes]|nr:hypothetical protein TNCV_4861861 [Trichonephila clavipes]